MPAPSAAAHRRAQVCLFHAMRGGGCHAREFVQTRALRYERVLNGSSPEGLLGGVLDPYDEAVYAAAARRFWSDVIAHNLSESTCRRLCPDAPAGAFRM